VVEKHDHVNFSVVAVGLLCLGVLDDGIQRAKRACQIVQTWRRDEFLVHTDKLGGLGVANVELEVDNAFTRNANISRHHLGEVFPVLIFDLEAIVRNCWHFFAKE